MTLETSMIGGFFVYFVLCRLCFLPNIYCLLSRNSFTSLYFTLYHVSHVIYLNLSTQHHVPQKFIPSHLLLPLHLMKLPQLSSALSRSFLSHSSSYHRSIAPTRSNHALLLSFFLVTFILTLAITPSLAVTRSNHALLLSFFLVTFILTLAIARSLAATS